MYIIVGADGREYGPVSADQLRQWIAEGRANAQTRIRLESTVDWKFLGELSEFAASFLPPAPIAPAIAPAPFSAMPPPATNQLAMTAMILGALSLTLGCCCYGLPFNVAGIICSLMALSQISKDPTGQHGKGLAIAGLVLSLLSLLMSGLLFAYSLSGTDLLKRLNRL